MAFMDLSTTVFRSGESTANKAGATRASTAMAFRSISPRHFTPGNATWCFSELCKYRAHQADRCNRAYRTRPCGAPDRARLQRLRQSRNSAGWDVEGPLPGIRTSVDHERLSTSREQAEPMSGACWKHCG